ncbi:MAG: hypothetical protein LKI42_05945 [Bacteroidales bacterium]|jgi:hypothetical protein|nr:hypothetical protein [Bacteroidales bacterium]MCI1785128.1 hypothetical protein [Bacteroidales bacterium]
MKTYIRTAIAFVLASALFAPPIGAQIRKGVNTGGKTSTESRTSSSSEKTGTKKSAAVRSASTKPSANRNVQNPVRKNNNVVRKGSEKTGVDKNKNKNNNPRSVPGNSQRQNNNNKHNNNKQTAPKTSVYGPAGGAVRYNSNVTKNNNDHFGNSRSNHAPDGGYKGNRDYSPHPGYSVRNHDRVRIPPRERDFLSYDRPHHFYAHDYHYYGYRVNYLPSSYRRTVSFGIEYYFLNGIYYRRYGNFFVVCRPPLGTIVTDMVADAVFSSVGFAYYYNYYRPYAAINNNLRYIADQNRIIARNNEIIASQNNSLAMNRERALNAYELANRLGLVQSFAGVNENYYYQDGVFYVLSSDGRYTVIVPPAGALVSSLPDDYDVITLGGQNFYRVDDTVYRLTLVSGIPYLEVLGQMYGSMAEKYDYYGQNPDDNYNSLW